MTGWGQYSRLKTLTLIYIHTEDRLGTLEVLSNSPVHDINVTNELEDPDFNNVASSLSIFVKFAKSPSFLSFNSFE